MRRRLDRLNARTEEISTKLNAAAFFFSRGDLYAAATTLRQVTAQAEVIAKGARQCLATMGTSTSIPAGHCQFGCGQKATQRIDGPWIGRLDVCDGCGGWRA